MDESQASATASRPTRLAIFSALLSGAIYMAIGVALLYYLIFGQDLMSRFMPSDRLSTYQLVVGALAWTFGLAAPTAFILLGLARLATGYKRLRARTSSFRR